LTSYRWLVTSYHWISKLAVRFNGHWMNAELVCGWRKIGWWISEKWKECFRNKTRRNRWEMRFMFILLWFYLTKCKSDIRFSLDYSVILLLTSNIRLIVKTGGLAMIRIMSFCYFCKEAIIERGKFIINVVVVLVIVLLNLSCILSGRLISIFATLLHRCIITIFINMKASCLEHLSP
jgi:hypothetical protein